MEKTTDYAALLEYTYSEYNTVLTRTENGFTFLIRNPERADGDVKIGVSEGIFTLSFFSMEEDFGDDFGEVVSFTDELLSDETAIFELLSEGEYVLGGSRPTEDIGRYRPAADMIDILADGDYELRTEILGYLEKGNCAMRVRGFRASRCFSIILAK